MLSIIGIIDGIDVVVDSFRSDGNSRDSRYEVRTRETIETGRDLFEFTWKGREEEKETRRDERRERKRRERQSRREETMCFPEREERKRKRREERKETRETIDT